MINDHDREDPIWRPQRNYNLEYFDSINLTNFLKQTAPELVILRVRDYRLGRYFFSNAMPPIVSIQHESVSDSWDAIDQIWIMPIL